MDDLERCYAAALRILKVRWNATEELRRKLRAKRFERDVINQTVERVQREGWLDDARFAGAYVRTRQARRVGTLRIRRELIAAGIDHDVAEQAVRENADSDKERDRAAALAARRVTILARRYAPEMVRNKLTAYLLKQGYDAALVREVVKEFTVVKAHH